MLEDSSFFIPRNASTSNLTLTSQTVPLPTTIAVWIGFSLVMALSIVGNGVVVWIILAHRQMRTPTNYFLLNLSLSDMVVTLQIVPNVSYALSYVWKFGIYICKISSFVTTFSISLTVFTFVAIAIERFMVIVFPLRPRPRSRVIVGSVILIWVFSFLSALPPFLLSNLDTTKACRMIYPEGTEHWSKLVDYMLFTFQSVLPLLIVSAAYIVIATKLWRQQPIGESSAGQGESIRAKRKVVKMMIIVVCIFAVCWIPYQVFFIAPFLNVSNYANYVFLAVYYLAMCSSVPNPFIYCKMNKKFRIGFKIVFRWLPCVHIDVSKMTLSGARTSAHTTAHFGVSTYKNINHVNNKDADGETTELVVLGGNGARFSDDASPNRSSEFNQQL